jgi:ABC-type branched-subunit amino acid transport system substrate-binding protein
VPLSGPLQPYGIQLVSGVRAAIDEANRFAAPLARVFGIRTFDDQDAITVAITNAEIAAADPAVIAMIGNLDNDVTFGTLAQYANLNLPLIVPTASADNITAQGYRNLLRLPTKDTTQGQLFARTVLYIVKPSNALAVTLDGTYGPAIAQGFVAQAKNDRRHADQYVIKSSNPDFSAAAKAIVDLKPDYVFLCGKTATLGPLIPALQTAGYAGALGASDGFYNTDTTQTYGAVLEGGRHRLSTHQRFHARLRPDHRILGLRLRRRANHHLDRAAHQLQRSQPALARHAKRSELQHAPGPLHLHLHRRPTPTQHVLLHHHRRRIQIPTRRRPRKFYPVAPASGRRYPTRWLWLGFL